MLTVKKRFLVALCLILLPGVALAADTRRFDGMWQTTVSCAAVRDALGYSYRFVSTVKDGVLHGLRGAAGQPGSSLQPSFLEADFETGLAD